MAFLPDPVIVPHSAPLLHCTESFHVVKYSKNFAPIHSVQLPRALVGKFWEYKPRIPELLDKKLVPIALFYAGCAQYRGLLESTGVANSGALYDTTNQHGPHFVIRPPHPLSQCVTHTYHKMPNGQKLILKDSAEKHTSISKPANQNRAHINGGNPISKNDDGTDFEPSAFQRIDKKICVIVQRVLPDMPHLVSVPTKNPYLPTFPFENRNTPFEDWEIKNLQHMTLISTGSRGVAWVKGDWQDEYLAASPYSAVRSGTETPRSERDPNKPRVKMSLADYRAGKRAQNVSQSTVSSLSQKVRNEQGSASVDPISPTQRLIDQIVQSSTSSTAAPKVAARLNAKFFNDIPRFADISPPEDIWSAPNPEPLPKPQNQAENGRVVWPPSTKPDWKKPQHQQTSTQRARLKLSDYAREPPHPEHSLNQPRHENIEQRSSLKKGTPQGKSLNSDAVTTSLKQAPISKPVSGTPVPPSDDNHNITEPKPTTLAALSTLQSEQLSNRTQELAEPSNSEPTNVMPPLLSPLPPGLMSPDHPEPATSGLPGPRPNQVTAPNSTKSNFTDTEPTQKIEDDVISPFESPLEMPPLLSPLPDWWIDKITRDEAELARHESLTTVSRTNASINSVGARHERSRQPDTLGVARKITKARSSNSTLKDLPIDSSSPPIKATRKPDSFKDKVDSTVLDRDNLIVKLKYGKRNTKAITRLLQMTVRQATEAKTVPISSPAASGAGVKKHRRSGYDAEEPSTKRPKVAADDASTPVLSRAEAKKHARLDDDAEEPSTKRSKTGGNIDIQRARSPLTPSTQSPAPSAPSTAQKAFNTPKKGDSMKSVAMRKVDSSDGRVLTPHGASASTPASAEKQKSGVVDSKSSEVEALRAVHIRYTTIGTTLKRQVDHILKVKEKDPSPVPEGDKRLGAVMALECALAYMVGFHSMDISRQKERKFGVAENWTGLFLYLNFATMQAKHHEELHTLALLLTAVSRESLERIYTDRLSMEPPHAVPNYLKDLAKNAGFRQLAWIMYRQQCKEHPVEFAITVEDIKSVAVAVLTDYSKKMGVEWENKLEF